MYFATLWRVFIKDTTWTFWPRWGGTAGSRRWGWQWAARWTVCHKRTAPEDILQLQFKAVQEPQSFILLELTTIFSPTTIELWRSRRWPVQATLLTQFWRMVLFSSSMRPVRSSHWICLAPSRRWTQPWELPISVGSTSEWLTLLHQRPNLRKIYSEQICSFWMSSAVRISWCSMCGSKFSWPPHCPQCSDWWEWKLFHVSLRPGSELLPWIAPQQFAPSFVITERTWK